MKYTLVLISLLFILSCSSSGKLKEVDAVDIIYDVDLNKSKDDLFHVQVFVNGLSANNNIYNFASTAPGTYTVMDFGRFVKSFKAYNSENKEIPVKKISKNKWQLSDAEKVKKIAYSIEDAFDPVDKSNHIMPMGSTSIEKDHIIINTFGVMGYIEGLQSEKSRLKLRYPKGWTIATALNKDSDDYYLSESFDHLADSPILIGNLTQSSINIGGIDVDIFVYSSKDSITANDILILSEDVLKAAGKFLTYAVVPRYTFIFAFIDEEILFNDYGFNGYGALEHSYSSFYVMPEAPSNMIQVKDFIAHEFFHVVTPLNIHSEIIGTYNFTSPIPSEHLWLYEGVTEWASHIMQLRDQQITLTEFLRRMSNKMSLDQRFYDKNTSLSELALKSYEEKGSSQYGNIYQRGAYIAMLLDVKLLKLSNGKSGLRELILNLSKKFGKNKSFSEKHFFKTISEMTFPEIERFFQDYVRGTKDYPVHEIMKTIGIKYVKEKESKNSAALLGIRWALNQEREVIVSGFARYHKAFGLKRGDIIRTVFGKDVNNQNVNDVLKLRESMAPGDSYKITVERDGKEIGLTGILVKRVNYNVFELDENASEEQLKLRKIWMKNL